MKKAASQFINEKVSDFLDSVKAVQKEAESADEDQAEDERADGIVTTEDELEAYQIVRAIFSQKVAPERIAHRDTKSYFGVLLDDNNRKPLCRFRFNTSQRYICLIDEKKNENRQPIDKVTEIYKFSQELIKTLSFYGEA